MQKKWSLPLTAIGLFLLLACNFLNLTTQNITAPAATQPESPPATIAIEAPSTQVPPAEEDSTEFQTNPDERREPQRIMDVSANGARSLAIDNFMRVWQWGTLYGPGSECGGEQTCLRKPTLVPGLDDVVLISAGETFSLALKLDGTVWGWGKNEIYQLGQGNNSQEYFPTPVQIPGLTDVTYIASSSNFSLALKKDGSVWAWGHQPMGALGNGKDSFSNVPYMYEASPAQVVDLTGIKAIAVGAFHSVAIDQNGQMWAWGSNQQGELGLGSVDNDQHPRPLKVPGMADVVYVAAGGNNTLAIRSDDSVWAWGANYLDQLATGEADFKPHPNPQQIEAFQGARIGVVSVLDTGVVKPNGSYWNTFGFTRGAQMAGLPELVWVSGKGNHQLGLTRDGQVWAWGENTAGQLGVESVANTFIPIQVEFKQE